MEDDLNFLSKMEDDLNFSRNGRRPEFFSSKLEDSLNFFKNGSRPQFLQKWKTKTEFQFGPKLKTKVALNTTTHTPLKTFEVVPGKLEA
jgi:hypothetical protein